MNDQKIGENTAPPADPEEEGNSFADNYGLAIAFGLPIGMIFGLLVFDNIAMGAAFGLAFSPMVALLMKSKNSEE